MYIFHTDPGHGWLEVPFAEIEALGIARDISHFSYRMADHVFLEEDCDASRFSAAYKAQHGEWPIYEERYLENTPIRRYHHYVKPSEGERDWS